MANPSLNTAFVADVCDRMSGAGCVTYRAMFGAFSLYLDGKIIGIVGNGEVYIKITTAGGDVWPNLPSVPPYEGAKPFFLLDDLDDRERLTAFLRATWNELPFPKPRKKDTL